MLGSDVRGHAATVHRPEVCQHKIPDCGHDDKGVHEKGVMANVIDTICVGTYDHRYEQWRQEFQCEQEWEFGYNGFSLDGPHIENQISIEEEGEQQLAALAWACMCMCTLACMHRFTDGCRLDFLLAKLVVMARDQVGKAILL